MRLPELLRRLFRRQPPRLVCAREPISAPLGYVPYQRIVSLGIPLESGLERAKARPSYYGDLRKQEDV
jgi:hypothetical protein